MPQTSAAASMACQRKVAAANASMGTSLGRPPCPAGSPEKTSLHWTGPGRRLGRLAARIALGCPAARCPAPWARPSRCEQGDERDGTGTASARLPNCQQAETLWLEGTGQAAGSARRAPARMLQARAIGGGELYLARRRGGGAVPQGPACTAGAPSQPRMLPLGGQCALGRPGGARLALQEPAHAVAQLAGVGAATA